MLKADLHLHTSEDPLDSWQINYSAKELIDLASLKGFDVLAITNHNQVYHNKKITDYANKKKILLIPGAEIEIDKKHVLVYNLRNEEIKKIKTFEDLKKIKQKKKILVLAPHPYYKLFPCLGKLLEENITIFDGIEYCHFYLSWFNQPNKKAKKIAKKNNLPMIGTSDAHNLWELGTTYSLIDSKKDILSVIRAVKEGNVILKTNPIRVSSLVKLIISLFLGLLKQKK